MKDQIMLIVSYTVNHGKNVLTDHYILCDTMSEAQTEYEKALSMSHDGDASTHCAAISKVIDATEPHWIEE